MGLSVVSHLVVFTAAGPWPFWPHRRSPPVVEVTYVAPQVLRVGPQAVMPKPAPARKRSAHPPLPPLAVDAQREMIEARIAAARTLPVPEKPALSKSFARLQQPSATQSVNLDIVPATSPALAKEPTFQLYYRSIRERIRARAYQVVPKPLQDGEVFLSFVVERGGALVLLQLDEAQSSSIGALRQAALRAVREAAPFPPFPPIVSQAQIAFTIVISFEEGVSR